MVNRVTLTGHLGANPDVKTMPSGDLAANVRLASTERYKDRTTGAPKESTEWHRAVFFGRLAEIARDYLVKGSRVYVDGKLRTRKWTAADGQDRYTTEVIVEHLEMLGGTRSDAVDSAETGSHSTAEEDEWARDYDRAASAEQDSRTSA